MYSVKSAYSKLVQGPKIIFAKSLWDTHVPLKFRIFSLLQATLDHLQWLSAFLCGTVLRMNVVLSVEPRKMLATFFSNAPLPNSFGPVLGMFLAVL